MNEQLMREFDVNGTDPELVAMSFLIQVMENYEKEHNDLALDGDIYENLARVSEWLYSRYKIS